MSDSSRSFQVADYLKGPAFRRRAEEAESELRDQSNECRRLRQQLATNAESMEALTTRYSKLQELAKRLGVMEVLAVQGLIQTEQRKLEELTLQATSKSVEVEVARVELAKAREQLLVVEEALLLESYSLYTPKFALVNSAAYKENLEWIRRRQKGMIKSHTAATCGTDWAVGGSLVEGRKLVKDMVKLVIRSFNNECDYCVDNVKFDNVDMGERRIRASFDALNVLGRTMNVAISDDYLNAKLDELRLAHEFQLKKQEEKEEARRARAELLEQQKLEQEIRAARERIIKERRHFAIVIADLERRLVKARSEQEISAIEGRLQEVRAGETALDGEEKLIDYRERNAKAGYVYVISNVGSFGEGVFKMGMTRRLEPMDRIDELGDASVPFCFDVHALIFSDDAPSLEAKLHARFAQTRMNRINRRREFFRATIDEIQDVIRTNYDPAAEVILEAPAQQYRDSLRMSTAR